MSGILSAMIAMDNATVDVQGDSVTDNNPTTAIVSYLIESDGTESKDEGGTPTDIGDWVTPKAVAGIGNYECRLTVNSGDAPTSGSATATWLDDTTNRFWTWTQSGAGSKTANLTIAIRDANTLLTLDSANFAISASVP